MDNYKPALEELSLEIAELENEALQKPGKETLNQILQVKKEVLHLRQIIGPQREVLARFARGEFKLIRPHLVPYYRNVYDGLFHISELAQSYTDSLTGILQVYLNMSSNQTGEVVKLLTMITVITTPVMIIGTWYGMNFRRTCPRSTGRTGMPSPCPDGGVDAADVLVSARNATGSEPWPLPKSSFLDKVLGRIGRLDAEGLQTVVQRLARERSFLETLFNTIEDGVLVVDEHGRILYFNQAVTRLLGLAAQRRRAARSTTSCRSWTGRSSRALDAGGGQRVVRHEFEVDYPRPRFLRLYAAPLDGEAAGSSGLALILHDATEARQKTFEAIESERIQALTLAGRQRGARDRQSAQRAAHSPAAHGAGAEEAEDAAARARRVTRRRAPARKPVRRQPTTPDVAGKLEQYLGVAKGEINRLDYIVTQFLQAIRPAPPQLKLTSLNDVVQKTAANCCGPNSTTAGITVKTKLARQLPAAPIDPTQIQQALVNLIKNAMQAMTKGGTLTLQTGEGADGVWVSVADTGGGIPQEQINRIFEPFYTTKKKGTGLGLMIVQRIVRAHGGRIELESHVGRGTTFRLWLPLHENASRGCWKPPAHD